MDWTMIPIQPWPYFFDYDNDGDLDVYITVNEIVENNNPSVYRNKSVEKNQDKARFLSVKLTGDSINRQGIGAWVELYYGGKRQVIEHTPYRGFLSTIQTQLHFGLGNISTVDSVVVIWPDNKKQTVTGVPSGQTLHLEQKNAKASYDWKRPVIAVNALFKDITDAVDIHYVHDETDFIDFNIQKLIPHKLSEYTPALATGDINNDGLDDIVIAGSFGNSPTLLFQQASGKFIQKSLLATGELKKIGKLSSIALFDADGDKDLDMYIACGSNEAAPDAPAYQDKLFINDGSGNFAADSSALPGNHTSKSCVRVADFDKDGDLDLFIGGRCYPWNYPKPVSSILLRNDSRERESKVYGCYQFNGR